MEAFLKTLRHLQIIIIALAAGLIVLGAVMIYMVLQVRPAGFIGGQGPQWNGVPLMTALFLGLGALNLFLSFVVPLLIVKFQTAAWAKQARPLEGELTSWETSDFTWLHRVPVGTLSQLLTIFHSSRIVAVALCEAAGMMCGIAYLLEAQLVSLVMVGISIALMLKQVPTQAMMSNWVFGHIERLKLAK